MPQSEVLLSVIIVSYNATETVAECLSSIQKHNDIGGAAEVILVDNSPSDGTYRFVKEHFPFVRAIKNKNNGFGAANNVGVSVSRGKYLLFLNPDALLVEPLFLFAVRTFERERDLALFGVRLCGRDGKKKASFFLLDDFRFFAPLKEKCCNALSLYRDGKMYICGADLFVRRSCFLAAGAFDENLFLYCEEGDLIRRIKARSPQKRTAFFKQKRLIHLEGQSVRSEAGGKEESLRRLVAARAYYNAKYALDHKKYLRMKYRYALFKTFCYRVARSKKAAEQSAIATFYKGRLQAYE